MINTYLVCTKDPRFLSQIKSAIALSTKKMFLEVPIYFFQGLNAMSQAPGTMRKSLIEVYKTPTFYSLAF